MRRIRLVVLSILALMISAHPLVAATFYVGNCKIGSFGTIDAAVASVPIGSTIDVCPGPYAEQVTISKSLTLQGIFNNNSAQAVITVPRSGLATTPSSVFGAPVAPQLWVTADSVTIKNITVDGTGGSNGCTSALVGIFYASGSSGTVNAATTRNQINSGCGVGVLAENATSAAQPVIIENSSVHDVDFMGIFAGSNQTPPTLTATIQGNYVTSKNYGIYLYFNAGTLTGNVVTGGRYGIWDQAPSSSVTANIVANSPFGIQAASAGDHITSNKIWNSSTAGIVLGASGTTIQSNLIININAPSTTTFGIEFGCLSGNVIKNTINDTVIGLDFVPASFNGVNTFYNVPTVRSGGC